MAYDEAVRTITLNCDSSLAGYIGVPGTPGAASPNWGKGIYRFVKLTGARQCGRAVVADVAADSVVGVAYSKPEVPSQETTVAIRGVVQVLAGGAFAPGDQITSDAQGRAVKVAASGDASLGVAIEGSDGTDTLGVVLLRING